MKKTTRKLWVTVLSILLFASTSFTYFYFAAEKANAAWWDDGWRYRVAVPISAHTSAETNVYLTLSGASGIDTTDATKFQTDCGDIRFTDSGGNILPYFLTTACGLSQTGFHVFFKTFPAGAQTIYYYYGNAGAANGFSLQDFGQAASGVTLGTRGSETNSPVSPIAFWKFDEGSGQGVNNSITSANAGTLGADATATSTDPTWTTEDLCISGKCLRFTSANSQYANFATSIAAVKSIGFWVRPTSTTTSLAVLNGATGNASVSVSSGTISAGAGFSSPVIYVNGVVSSTLIANTWQYIVVTTGTGITASNIMLGRVDNGYFSGFMDEVKVYGITLTASQIKANYSSGVAKMGAIKGSSVTFGSSTASTYALSNGLLGYWKMDESSGNPADSSGNDIPLINNGATAYTAGKYGNGAGTFNGSSTYFSTGTTIHTVQTVSFWAYPTSTTNNFINFASGVSLFSTSGTLTANGFFSPTVFVNGIQTATIAANKWQFITVTGTAAISANAFEIGRANGSYYSNGSIIDEVRLYGRVLSSAEVNQLYSWAPGPVGYWGLDEGVWSAAAGEVKDSSGNNNNGQSYGSPIALPTGGKVGRAGEFAASKSQYIGVPYNSALNPTSSLTVSAWFKTTTSGNMAIVSRFSAASPYPGFGVVMKPDYTCGSSDGQLGFWVGDNTNYYLCTSASYNDGQWHYVTGTYDGANAILYVDGVYITSAARSNGLNQTSENLYIGNDSFNRYYTGLIDDVKIYGYARTPKQIVEDMNGSHPAVTGKSMAGYWKFDEGYGDTAFNSGFVGSVMNADLGSASYTCPGNSVCPTWTSNGKYGKALLFSGGQAVGISSNSSLNFGNGSDRPFTISAWINPSSSAAFPIFSKAGDMATSGPEWIFYANGNGSSLSLQLYDTNAANWITANSNDAISVNRFTHVVATYDGSGSAAGIKMYFDGKPVATGTTTQGTYTAMRALGQASYIGALWPYDGTYGAFANGTIDEVKIYNYALTFSEVKTDFNNRSSSVLGSFSDTSKITGTPIPVNSSTAAYCVPGSSDPCSAPIMQWKLDENSGTTANDTSNNGNTVTFTSGATAPAWSPGKVGSALKFDGTNDYARSASALNFSSAYIITVEFWLKWNTFTNDDRYAMTTSSQWWSNAGAFGIAPNESSTGKFQVGLSNEISGLNTVEFTQPSSGVWHHFVFVMNRQAAAASVITPYIDGVPVSYTKAYTQAQSSQPFANQTMYLMSEAGTNYFGAGTLDDVRIYAYARTPAQIIWDYSRGAPIGWYKFDECQGGSSYNSALNANGTAAGLNGTITLSGNSLGTCTSSTATDSWYLGSSGKYNSALGLDGNDYVTVTDTANYAFASGTQNFSAFAWIKRAATGATHYVISKEDAANDGWNMQVTSGNLVSCAVNNVVFTSSSTIDTNWHYIGCVINRAGLGQVYVDGQPDGTAVSIGSAAMAIASTTTTIGVRNYTPAGTYFNGLIDDVRILNYAPTLAQIKLLYNQNDAVRFGPATGAP